jgi:hypothetical protein
MRGGLPDRPPRVLWGLAVVLALVALAVTPSLLIRLGPMRRSLTSDVQVTRHAAQDLVLVARLLSGGGALLSLGLALGWSRVRALGPLCAIAAHEPVAAVGALRWRVSLGVLGLGLCVGLALAVATAGSSWSWIWVEDGLIEQVTAVFFGAACVLAARCALAFRRAARGGRRELRGRALVHAGMALFFFLCVGEEISWGQRIFGWHGTLGGLNVQGETNLHNLAGYSADHLFILGVFAWGVGLPLLQRFSPFWRRFLDLLGIPVPSPGLAVGFALVSLVHDWTIQPWLPRSEIRYAELREALSGLGFLLLTTESWRLSRAVLSQPLPDGSVSSQTGSVAAH